MAFLHFYLDYIKTSNTTGKQVSVMYQMAGNSWLSLKWRVTNMMEGIWFVNTILTKTCILCSKWRNLHFVFCWVRRKNPEACGMRLLLLLIMIRAHQSAGLPDGKLHSTHVVKGLVFKGEWEAVPQWREMKEVCNGGLHDSNSVV